jgi:splicing factor U2AF subunit
MAQLGLPGAPFVVPPPSSSTQITTGAVATAQPYRNQFGVLVTPTPGAMTNPVMVAPGIIGYGTAMTDPQARQQRRIYVGNIPRDTTEQELIAFFNEIMKKARISHEDAVLQATVNYEKNFAFLDFRTPEHATHAMGLDGIKLRDQYILKIRRPKDYKAPGELDSSQPALPGLVSTNVPDSAHKLFIGGLPSQMTEDQVQALLQSFGPLKAFNLVKDSGTGLSKGYAFCEYTNSVYDTDRAISGLNGVEMSGKRLLVQRASVGTKNEADFARMGLAGNTDISMLDPEKMAIANMLNLQVRIDVGLAGLITACNLKEEPTRVLVLLNMFYPGDIKDDSKYDQMLLDVRQECSKFGRVKSLAIPRDGESGSGKVFIEYEKVEDAERAIQQLQSRKYQGRAVITTYHPVDDYLEKRY